MRTLIKPLEVMARLRYKFDAFRSVESHVVNVLPVPTGILRTGWVALALGMTAMAAWASLAPLSGAVVAEGVVKADGNRKTVQHQEGGIIRRILVKDGDHVKAGQVLITLDDVRTDANMDNLVTQVDAEHAKAARLTAERDFANEPDFQQFKLDNARVMELVQREAALFTARRQALDTQISLTKREISEVSQEIATLTALTKTARESQLIAENETRINQKLKDQGFISDVRLMELRRNHTDYRAKSESQLAELARASQKKTELELKIAGLRNDYIKAATDELKETSNRLFKLEEELRPLKDSQMRQSIVAPVAGEIVDLKFHSSGAVIGPREPILDIAPIGAQLIIEAKIKPENIKDIAIKSHADVRLTAYRQRSTPTLEGYVTYVGADRLTDKTTNQPYYPAHIQIAPQALQAASRLAGQPIELSQGMQAEVFIKTQERSAFDYLIEPINSGLRRGMRER